MGMLVKGEVQVKTADARAVAVAVVRNWILLGMFEYGQGSGGQKFIKFVNNREDEQVQ